MGSRRLGELGTRRRDTHRGNFVVSIVASFVVSSDVNVSAV